MALPTMHGYWSCRKNIYENAIVKQRDHENDFRTRWTETANYFKNSDVLSAKQQAWSSSDAYSDICTDNYQKSVDQDIKMANLKRRRDKLAQMLATEGKNYQVELRGISRPNLDRMQEMRMRMDELKNAREESRQNLAEKKLYQHWRENNPDLRKMESQLVQEEVVSEWGSQKLEKEQGLESARQEKLAFEKEMERERRAAMALEREKEEDKLQEKKSLQEILKEQMMEFKERQIEAEVFKMQQETLLKEKWELERTEELQQQREEERKKKDLGRALLRQHKTQMMRKSRVIQKELEQDRKLLEALIEKEQEQTAVETARRERARADAQWMKEVIEDQLQLEKVREAELDMLYQDEAARIWQKREAEWNKERQARHRLMAEVLESRQQQIGDKLEQLQHQQKESLQRREELMREMEVTRQMTRREDQAQLQSKIATKTDLEEQIMTRREREVASRKEMVEDLQRYKQEEADYEAMLQQEAQRMRIQGGQSRNYGRSKQAWH